MTTFRTARLLLRPFEAGDQDDIVALDSDPAVMRYIGDGSPRGDPAIVAERIPVLRRFALEHPGQGLFITRRLADDAFLGWSALKPLDDTGEIEVGYRFMEHAWGHGYATEAARFLVAHGFTSLRLPRIVGVTHPDNRASQRVLEKAGLVYVRDAFVYETDVRWYEVSGDAWRASRASCGS